MAMYNTGNPVGSTQPKDLSDNAQVLDKLVVGTDPSVVDRLGNLRYSWAGMEYDFQNAQAGREAAFQEFLAASAFVFIGDYAAGLNFTNRNQYMIRDGVPYRLSPSTTLPYTTTGNWALEAVNFSPVSQDDILRQDLGAADGLSHVGFGSVTAQEALSLVSPLILSSIDGIPSASLPVGTRCKVGETTYRISSAPSPDVKYPLIPAGPAKFAIPESGHVMTSLGSMADRGSVSGSAFSSNAMQGAVIDNRNRSIIFSATNSVPPLETSSFYEYDFNEGVLGPLLASAVSIPAGHADNFAVEVEPDGTRYLWFGRPKTETYGAMDICRLRWVDGASAGDVELMVAHNAYAALSWYDHESFLIISGTNVADVCLLSDLKTGTYSPIRRLSQAEWVGLVAPTYFPQTVRHVDGLWFGLSGFNVEDAGAYASVSSRDAPISRMGFTAAANPGSELQSFAWRWDAALGKFRNLVAVKAQAASSVQLLEVSEPGVRHSLSVPVNGSIEFTDRVTASSRRGKLSSEIQLFKGSVYVGGVPIPGVNFDYRDFRLEQWRNDGGRLQHRYMHWDSVIQVIDGPGDTLFDQGWRFNILSGDRVHIHKDGMQVGGASLASDANRGKYTLRVIGGWGAAAGGAPAVQVVSAVAGVVSTSDVDLAVPDGGVLQLGQYNTSTNTSQSRLNLTTTDLSPAVSGGLNFGTATFRIGTVFAQNALNTSDGRLKTPPRKLTDGELAAGLELASLPGVWQWLDAVSEKGEAARWHTGPTVQQAIEVLKKHGLDPFRYGAINFDQWEDQWEDRHPVGNEPPERVLRAAAGSVYSFNYNELSMFMIRALAWSREASERRMSDLEARLSALEAK